MEILSLGIRRATQRNALLEDRQQAPPRSPPGFLGRWFDPFRPIRPVYG
jgi:hypothetical protein